MVEMNYKLGILKEGRVSTALLTVLERPNSSLQLVSEGFDSGVIEDEKVYYCLKKLHKKLDVLGIKLLCNGCRRDVRPSRMSIDMGGGTLAYKHVLGRKPTENDLVNIFDPTDDLESIVSVEEQDEYYKQWLRSIGIKI